MTDRTNRPRGMREIEKVNKRASVREVCIKKCKMFWVQTSIKQSDFVLLLLD